MGTSMCELSLSAERRMAYGMILIGAPHPASALAR